MQVMGDEDLYKLDVDSLEYLSEIGKKVSRSLAICTLSCSFYSVDNLRDGGYEMAVKKLNRMREDNEKYGWGVK